jgi:hypothetical protein
MKIQIFKELTQYIQQSTRGRERGNSLNMLKTHLGAGPERVKLISFNTETLS